MRPGRSTLAPLGWSALGLGVGSVAFFAASDRLLGLAGATANTLLLMLGVAAGLGASILGLAALFAPEPHRQVGPVRPPAREGRRGRRVLGGVALLLAVPSVLLLAFVVVVVVALVHAD